MCNRVSSRRLEARVELAGFTLNARNLSPAGTQATKIYPDISK